MIIQFKLLAEDHCLQGTGLAFDMVTVTEIGWKFCRRDLPRLGQGGTILQLDWRPRGVDYFPSHRIGVLSVSCGGEHTMAVTTSGVRQGVGVGA